MIKIEDSISAIKDKEMEYMNSIAEERISWDKEDKATKIARETLMETAQQVWLTQVSPDLSISQLRYLWETNYQVRIRQHRIEGREQLKGYFTYNTKSPRDSFIVLIEGSGGVSEYTWKHETAHYLDSKLYRNSKGFREGKVEFYKNQLQSLEVEVGAWLEQVRIPEQIKSDIFDALEGKLGNPSLALWELLDFLPIKQAKKLNSMVEKYFGSTYGLTNNDELVAVAAARYSVAKRPGRFSPDLISFAGRWFFPHTTHKRQVWSMFEEEIERDAEYDLIEILFSAQGEYKGERKVGELSLKGNTLSYKVKEEYIGTPWEEELRIIQEQGACFRPTVTENYSKMREQDIFIDEVEIIPISDKRFLRILEMKLHSEDILLRKKVK